MTNIDHDALARRIAENLTRAHYLVVPFNSLNDVSAWERVVAIIATSLREALPTSETCEWTQQSESDDHWGTDCGKEFVFIDGSPTENGMSFCCFCGKKLINVPFDEPEDEGT